MYLGIETSSLVSSVAVGDETRLLGELTVQAGLTHSEQLVPHIQLLLEQARLTGTDIDAVVVSIGPGSFTGLRIGLATAKALAYGWQKPILGIMTMDSMALNVPYCDRLISVMVDAQKKNIYEGRYRFTGSQLIAVQKPQVKSRAEALAELTALGEPVLLMGDGAVMARKELDALSPDLLLAPPALQIPRASSLLQAALPRLKAGEADDEMDLVPYYIRRSEAEVLWEKRHEGQASC